MTPAVKMLTPKKIAAILDVSHMSVYRLIEREELRAHRIGRNYRIDPRDFADYMRANSTYEDDEL